MQILGPDEGALPPLTPAPMLERLLYESPTIPVALLAIAAIFAAAAALRSRRKTPGLIGAALLALLATGVYFTARSVTTPRERLGQRAAELVEAVAGSDVPGVRALLADPFRIGPSDHASGSAARVPRITSSDQLVSVMTTRLGSPGSFIGSCQILETRTGLDGPATGRTQVRVRVRGPQGELFGHSWWEVEWRLLDDAWLATRIEAIWIQG